MAASSYTLKEIPEDVYNLVLAEQSEIKKKKRINQFSFESTIYKMIRDYCKCRKESPDFKPEPV